VPAASPDLTAIAFATPEVGWAVGPGLIWRSDNGGRTWRAEYAGRADLTGVDAVSPAVAYAWGGAALWRTDDGGRVWQGLRVPNGPSYDAAVLSLSAAGASVAYVAVGSTVATAAATFVSHNGGGTWARVRTPLPFGQLAFTSASDGWAVTRLGADVYRTVDGGRTWTRSFTGPVPTPPGTPLSGVLTSAGPTGAYLLLIGGSGMSQTSYSVYHTTDGAQWDPVVAVSTAGAGPAPGNPHGVATGPHTPGYGLGSSPGPIAASGGVALLVGVCRACDNPTTDVVRSTDGGHTWSAPVRLADTEGMPTFSDLSLPSPQVGYLAVPGFAGQPAVIFATRDGGRTWRLVWRSGGHQDGAGG
jgi:photosystem II stability/assembly factor-like uncharacterized protein